MPYIFKPHTYIIIYIYDLIVLYSDKLFHNLIYCLRII